MLGMMILWGDVFPTLSPSEASGLEQEVTETDVSVVLSDMASYKAPGLLDFRHVSLRWILGGSLLIVLTWEQYYKIVFILDFFNPILNFCYNLYIFNSKRNLS
jgi:hypothetical protein